MAHRYSYQLVNAQGIAEDMTRNATIQPFSGHIQMTTKVNYAIMASSSLAFFRKEQRFFCPTCREAARYCSYMTSSTDIDDLNATTLRPVPPVARSFGMAYGAYGLFVIALFTADFSRGVAGLKPGEILLALMVGGLVLRRVLIHDNTFVTTPIDLGFLVLFGVGTLLPLVTAEIRGLYITTDTLRSLLGPIEYYLWYRVMLEAIPLPTKLPDIFRVVLITITGISAIGVLQYVHFPLVNKFITKYYDSHNVDLSVLFHRSTSVVGGWETLGMLSVVAILLINQLLAKRATAASLFGTYGTPVLLVMGAINIAALFTTKSVTGVLAFVIGIGLALLLNRPVPRLTMVVAAAGIVAGIPLLATRLLSKGQGLAIHLPTSWVTRAAHWTIVWATITAHSTNFIFGVRPDFGWPVKTFNSTESMYLLLLYRGGIIYLLGFIVFMTFVLMYLIRVWRKTTGTAHEVMTGILTVFLVYVLIDILDAHTYSAGEWQVLMTLLAIGAGISLQTDRRGSIIRGTAFAALPVATRAALSVAAAVVVLAAGFGWNNNRHLTPPAADLYVLPYPIANPTQVENNQIGTFNWQIDSGVITTDLQGYAGAASAAPGDVVPLYISASTAMRYTFSVYRIGWYQGWGGRLFYTSPTLTAQTQGTWSPSGGLQHCGTCQLDSKTHLLDANWQQSFGLTVGADWASGVYLIKLVSQDRAPVAESYIPLIVRAPAGNHSQLLVSVPVNTYQAYNIWGGQDLYTQGGVDPYSESVESPNRATAVSFNRPYARSDGAGDFLDWDIHTVRWMERMGVDVSYTTNVDIDQRPKDVEQHHVFVSLGHDEYWTRAIRVELDSARLNGVNLAFFGAGDGYWQARLTPDAAGKPDRTLVCYRVNSYAVDPTQKLTQDPDYNNPQTRNFTTALWRDPIFYGAKTDAISPEQDLIGLMYSGEVKPDTHPEWVVPDGKLDQIETLSSTLAPGQHLKGGIIGPIYDTYFGSTLRPGLVLLAQSPVVNAQGELSTADASFYFTGANTLGYHSLIFDAGSLQWSWALDEFTFPGADSPNTLRGEQHIEWVSSNMLRTVLP